MRNIIGTIGVIGLLSLPLAAAAQEMPSDVTFEVPLDLTRLPPEITQVDITCHVTGDGIKPVRVVRGSSPARLTGNKVLNVTQGRLVTLASVVVAVPAAQAPNLVGMKANYECMITAFSTGTRQPNSSAGNPGGWGFLEERSANPSFNFTPTPRPLTGSFTW